ncbi:MAG: cytochrome c biogenesis protein CcsA [Bacteroidota bacterium]
MDIQYVGEHLLPGQLGHFSLLLSLVTAFLSVFFYFQSARENPADTQRWKHWGRYMFLAHSLFVIVASAMLMYLLVNRYYEYRYVWAHTENNMGPGYLIAAFWAGQEGSLLFWLLCPVVAGLFILKYAGLWEKKVMTIVGSSQFLMSSMLLGITVWGTEVGMSPFTLLREVPENAANAFFQNPHYLTMILDGNGLNPLLRNFWMMSHPPVLFIGFAITLVPFAYGIAGLWSRKYIEWIRPSLPWTNLAIFFLGAGILLGGVWAYESLTFGGFWAWDPIENASLVPWLILVAALHLQLVAKRKQENIFPAFLFTFLAFAFVVYSTYLTRSGVLSDTSVHSFGNDGMGGHILVYLFFLLILSMVVLLRHYKRIPSKENNEPISKEFWLFIAAMVLVLSSFQIIFTTSIPVWNQIFGSELSPPTDVVQHYNTWQLPFAVIVAFLMGLAHFLKWGKNNLSEFFRRIALSVAMAAGFALLIILLTQVRKPAHIIFLFAGMFAFFSSLDMLLRFRKTLGNTPALVSHLGIALFFIAILLTFSQKEIISKNTSGYNLGEAFPANENLLLIKDEILPMGSYYVTYKGNYREGEDIFYQIDFLRQNEDGEYYLVFESLPSIKLNETMGNVYNPYAKIYPGKDVFTYITFADVDNQGEPREPELLGQFEMTRYDTLVIDNNKMVLSAIEALENSEDSEADVVVEAGIDVITHFGDTFRVNPRLVLSGRSVHYHDDVIRDLDYRFRFSQVSEKPFTIMVDLYREQPEFIIIKTIIFPYINLLWLSCIVMLVGFWMTFRKRWKTRESVS